MTKSQFNVGDKVVGTQKPTPVGTVVWASEKGEAVRVIWFEGDTCAIRECPESIRLVEPVCPAQIQSESAVAHALETA